MTSLESVSVPYDDGSAAGTADATAYVRREAAPTLPRPGSTLGIIGWMRDNLFSSVLNSILTIVALYLIWLALSGFLEFAVFDAVWSGTSREACLGADVGACWPFIEARLPQFIYGRFPIEERWRVDIVFFLLYLSLIGAAYPRRPLNVLGLLVVVGIIAFAAYQTRAGFDLRSIDLLVAQLDRLDLTALGIHLLDIRPASTGTVDALGVVATIVLMHALFIAMPKRLVGIFFLAVFPFITVILLSGGDIPVGASWWIALAIVAVVVEVLIFLPVALGEALTGERIRSGLGALVPLGYVALVYLALAADFGLTTVQTDLWGGLLITLVAAITGIVASMPIGILLALGRRSELPLIRLLSVGFIEIWRGVPLITVLFFASVMLPLFIPGQINKLLAALIGIVMFSSAYIAEVVRGGLQAIPKGQYEGADAVGLSHWQKMRLIILPQALKHVIPGIMNSFIALFKDTSLLLIIGILDFAAIVRLSMQDPNWSNPMLHATGWTFAALVFWSFCFAMSRYSLRIERQLETSYR